MSFPAENPRAESVLASPAGRILVADDTPENVRLLKTFLNREGYEVITAVNGQEAVECCRDGLPDVIIMDVAMPQLNGFEATREIRRLFPDTWIPIIFLSAHSSPISQAHGLDSGGDDYLVKPVNLAILHEKIKAMRRIAASQARVARYALQLEESIEATRADQEFAKHLMQHILKTTLDTKDGIHQWVQPAEHFSGDTILTTRGPGGEIYVMLADAAGHGLAAAISVLPVIEAFYRLAEKGFTVGSIVRELNRKVHRLMPRERFISAAIAVISPAEHSLQLWNGGLPEVCFLNKAGTVARSWASAHPPLGTETDDRLESQPEVFSWSEPGQLVMLSDGLEDAENLHGKAFGRERILRILGSVPPAERLDALVQSTRNHLDGRSAHDDISLVLVDCPMDDPTALPPPVTEAASPERGMESMWRFSLRLEAEQLRSLDIVPLLMSLMDQLQLDEQHRGLVFMILSELVNNALDHGLLRLDSVLKQQPEGFERYLNARAERLANLQSGAIALSVEQLRGEHFPVLEITVQDSGEGFDHEGFIDNLTGNNTVPSGRGIALIRSIAGSLRFQGKGNEAVARLPLQPAAP